MYAREPLFTVLKARVAEIIGIACLELVPLYINLSRSGVTKVGSFYSQSVVVLCLANQSIPKITSHP